MALANLRLIKDPRTSQDRARAAIEAYNARSDERIMPWPIPVCNGSYLDVDAILAHSLPKLLSQRLHAVSRKESLLDGEVPALGSGVRWISR